MNKRNQDRGEPNTNGISRREAIKLGAAGAVAISFPSLTRAGGPGGVNNIGRQLIPFTIINNSGSTEPAYLYLFGQLDPLNPKKNSAYLSSLDGDLTKFEINDTAGKHYGLKLTGTTVDAFFPQLDGVRIYISFGKKLFTTTDAEGFPGAISADVPGANYKTLWDFSEFTWHNYGDHTILDGNVTQVDAFGLAFKVQFTGSDPADPQLSKTVINGFDVKTARPDIFKELAKVGAPWSDLVISDVGIPIRALQPIKGIEAGFFPDDQLAGYISEVLAYYNTATSNRLIFGFEGVNYTGETTGKVFTFTPDKAKDVNGKPTHTYTAKFPETKFCYGNVNIATPDDAVGQEIGKALLASLVRSTLVFYPSFPVPQQDRSLYYVNPPVFEYSKIIHKYGINNHAFCFGYDEYQGDAGPARSVRNPTTLTLTINGV